MAEIIGTIASAVTLAELFKLCVEAFDLIRTAQNQETDIKKLGLRLNIEKCRLYVWGQAMGLTVPTAKSSLPRPIDNCPFSDIIIETFTQILELFGNSRQIEKKYGCKSLQITDNEGSTGAMVVETTPIRQMAASFGDFKIKTTKQSQPSKFSRKFLWVIHDRDKFQGLIREVKDFIDGLQDITKGLSSAAQQEGVIKTRIMAITDIDTLEMLSDVCEADHPNISDAASVRAEFVSMAPTERLNVAAWSDTVVEDAESDNETIADLESLTITELKHRISGLMRESQERRQRAALATQTLPELVEDPNADITLATAEASGLDNLLLVGDSESRDWPGEEEKRIIRGMAVASTDKDFKDEFDAIKQWSDILSAGERDYVLFFLAQSLTKEQRRFQRAAYTQMCVGDFYFSQNLLADFEAEREAVIRKKDAGLEHFQTKMQEAIEATEVSSAVDKLQ